MESSDHSKNGAYPKSHTSRKINYKIMKKYLIRGVYNADGAKGLTQEGGTGRKNTIEKMVADLGGKMLGFYYAFGEDDVIVISELPDDISAASVGLKVNAAGLVRITTTVLLSPEDIDEASKKAVSYRGPGAK